REGVAARRGGVARDVSRVLERARGARQLRQQARHLAERAHRGLRCRRPALQTGQGTAARLNEAIDDPLDVHARTDTAEADGASHASAPLLSRNPTDAHVTSARAHPEARAPRRALAPRISATGSGRAAESGWPA